MFFPVMLNLTDKEVVVIGGGQVALRKVLSLLQYQCKIKIISPNFLEEFNELKHKIQFIYSEYRDELIHNSDIVIAATSSNTVNKDIGEFCRKNNILCNLADNGQQSDFLIPSSIKRGDLVITVSTLGNSPALAAKIKRELEEKYTEEYEKYVYLLGEVRRLVLSDYKNSHIKKNILNQLTNMSYEELIKWRNEYEGCGGIKRK